MFQTQDHSQYLLYLLTVWMFLLYKGIKCDICLTPAEAYPLGTINLTTLSEEITWSEQLGEMKFGIWLQKNFELYYVAETWTFSVLIHECYFICLCIHPHSVAYPADLYYLLLLSLYCYDKNWTDHESSHFTKNEKAPIFIILFYWLKPLM